MNNLFINRLYYIRKKANRKIFPCLFYDYHFYKQYLPSLLFYFFVEFVFLAEIIIEMVEGQLLCKRLFT